MLLKHSPGSEKQDHCGQSFKEGVGPKMEEGEEVAWLGKGQGRF